MLASIKTLLNKFSASQPALQQAGTPAATAGLSLGDLIVAEAAAAQDAATTAAEAYDAGTPADWATAAPTTVKDAIDRIAALVKTLNTDTAIP